MRRVLTLIFLAGSAMLLAALLTSWLMRPSGARYKPGDRISQTPGLENVLVFAPDVLSGSEPEGTAGLDTLARLGVRSILCVDAAPPPVELARERGLIYAHVPIKYDGIAGEQRLLIAKALRDLPKPVYVHCHHGKHRGPAAAAFGLVSLGELTPERAVELMRAAGTSKSYQGLYADVRQAPTLAPGTIDALAPGPIPELAKLDGLTGAMAEIGRTFDEITLIADHGWTTPPDHPDIELEHTAPLLADLFRSLAMGKLREENAIADARYRALMQQAADQAARLETAIGADDLDQAQIIRAELADSCQACHDGYR